MSDTIYLEFLGIWEQIKNTNFKHLEFEGFKKQAGLNSFTLTAKQWRDANSVLIHQGLTQS